MCPILAQYRLLATVGGEFPVAASSASERAESSEKLKALRGQTVVLVFSMQVEMSVSVCIIFLSLFSLVNVSSMSRALSVRLTNYPCNIHSKDIMKGYQEV